MTNSTAELRKLREDLLLLRTEQLRRAEKAAAAPPDPILQRIRLDGSFLMRNAGLQPDPWQDRLIRSTACRIKVLCTRRAGKSRAVATRVLARCLTNRNFNALIFSPTQFQSMEFLDYVRGMSLALKCSITMTNDARREIRFSNGSTAISLPDSPSGVVGVRQPHMLVIDEGAKVSDALYYSVFPMAGLENCEIDVLSTPFGKRGWFFELFDRTSPKGAGWEEHLITADHCPRLSRPFLDEAKLQMGDRWYKQEFYCDFVDAVDAVFSSSVIAEAMSDEVQPLFGGRF